MHKRKILIADDDRTLRSALRARLSAWGYIVHEASDGLGVTAQAAVEDVAAIILDHEMPNGNGQDIARLIRKECAAPIIFLSGHDREEFRQTVYALPDVYFLSKPLNAPRLRELLETCVFPANARNQVEECFGGDEVHAQGTDCRR